MPDPIIDRKLLGQHWLVAIHILQEQPAMTIHTQEVTGSSPVAPTMYGSFRRG